MSTNIERPDSSQAVESALTLPVDLFGILSPVQASLSSMWIPSY